MSQRKRETEIDIPSVKKCPQCAAPIFVDELECSRCGYSVATLQQRIMALNPVLVAGLGLLVGIMLSIAGLNEQGLLSLILLGVGIGSVVGGGLFWAAHFLLSDPLRKR